MLFLVVRSVDLIVVGVDLELFLDAVHAAAVVASEAHEPIVPAVLESRSQGRPAPEVVGTLERLPLVLRPQTHRLTAMETLEVL